MNEIKLIVSVVIPTEKEHYIEELFALANKYGIKPSEENIANGVRYVFSFSNQKLKEDFNNSIPVEWL